MSKLFDFSKNHKISQNFKSQKQNFKFQNQNFKFQNFKIKFIDRGKGSHDNFFCLGGWRVVTLGRTQDQSPAT